MTNKLQIKLLSENATMPQRNHNTDAGFDIYAAETVVLEPQEKALIATDIAVNIPKGYVGLLTSRSGVSSKTHLVIETGKIDAGFTGNMKINIKNDYVYEDP
ncbi:dUTP pyrophosphatase, partial [Staphylococcus pseudintermedius]|nr:dUTP pyrophosphatase [Staphylococcus pseudintermedius]